MTGLGLQGSVGSFRVFGSNRERSFYSLGYRGSTLLSHGQSYSSTSIAKEDPIDFGDQPVYLKVDNGKSSVGGTVVNNLQAIRVPNLVRADSVRFLVGFDAQTQRQPQQNLLFGVEYRPNLAPSSKAVVAKGGSAGPASAGSQERFIAFGFATEKHTTSFTPSGHDSHVDRLCRPPSTGDASASASISPFRSGASRRPRAMRRSPPRRSTRRRPT